MKHPETSFHKKCLSKMCLLVACVYLTSSLPQVYELKIFMSLIIHFKSLDSEIFSLTFRIDFYSKEFKTTPEIFELIWNKLFLKDFGNLAVKIENVLGPENRPGSVETIIFLPDKSLKPRVTFTNDGALEKVFLTQYGVDICEIPIIHGVWEIYLSIIPRGKINNLYIYINYLISI